MIAIGSAIGRPPSGSVDVVEPVAERRRLRRVRARPPRRPRTRAARRRAGSRASAGRPPGPSRSRRRGCGSRRARRARRRGRSPPSSSSKRRRSRVRAWVAMKSRAASMSIAHDVHAAASARAVLSRTDIEPARARRVYRGVTRCRSRAAPALAAPRPLAPSLRGVASAARVPRMGDRRTRRDGPPGHRRQPLHDARDARPRRRAVALPRLLHARPLSDFYWVSSPEAHHSRNVLERPEVQIVIFDSSVAVGHAEAVYLSARARAVPEAELAAVVGEAFGERGGARPSTPRSCTATGTCASTWRARPPARS